MQPLLELPGWLSSSTKMPSYACFWQTFLSLRRSTDWRVRRSRYASSSRRSTERSSRAWSSKLNFPPSKGVCSTNGFYTFPAFIAKRFCRCPSSPATTVPAVPEECRTYQKLIKFTLIKHNTSLPNAFLTRNLLSSSCIFFFNLNQWNRILRSLWVMWVCVH